MGSLSNNARVNVSAWMGILHHLCPRCRTGRIFGTSIFRIFPRMHERCPVCGLKFEREQGYFSGCDVLQLHDRNLGYHATRLHCLGPVRLGPSPERRCRFPALSPRRPRGNLFFARPLDLLRPVHRPGLELAQRSQLAGRMSPELYSEFSFSQVSTTANDVVPVRGTRRSPVRFKMGHFPARCLQSRLGVYFFHQANGHSKMKIRV